MKKIKQSKFEEFQCTALSGSKQISVKGGTEPETEPMTEPEAETKIKTLQKVVDVRGMG